MSRRTIRAAVLAATALHSTPSLAASTPSPAAPTPRRLLERAYAANGGSVAAAAAGMRSQGFVLQGPPQVGAVALEGSNRKLYTCSATLVSRSVILTAAHCVYTIGGGYDRRLAFAPGMRSAGSGIATPYGVFAAKRLWAPKAYRRGHELADYAFVEFAPRADGVLPGDVAGYSPTAAGLHLNRGQRVVEMGYPAEGFFATAAGHYGRDPFECDTTVGGYLHAGRYKAVVSRCTMNGGASGGPWFTLLRGVPTIVGINDWCQGPRHCHPLARRVLSSYFGRGYLRLWRRVVRSGAV